jgi:hypothetical protein
VSQVRAHVLHRFSTWDTPTYSGGDHICMDEPLDEGRFHRGPGDPLCKPLRSWPKRGAWSQPHEELDRAPSCKRCQEIARRLGINELVGRKYVYLLANGVWIIEPIACGSNPVRTNPEA